jgi:glucosylceramidase
MWGLTVVNEPHSGYDPHYAFNSLGFSAEQQRDFVKLDLGPAMESAGYGGQNGTKLMIFDDNRGNLPEWARTVLSDKGAAKYIAGTAFHWYSNNLDNLKNLDAAHQTDPSKFLLATEACEGWYGNQRVLLGSWERFETYANDVIRVSLIIKMSG